VTAFSTVAEFAWQDNGCLLAFTVDAEGIAGSGVHLSDPRTSLPWLLDSNEATFAGLAGREKDDDLACYRSGPDIDDEEDTQVVLAWRDLGSAGAAAATKAYDQAADQTPQTRASSPSGARSGQGTAAPGKNRTRSITIVEYSSGSATT
jgi:hypothetical protein